MKADDANFELNVSNTIEKLTLYHRTSIFRRKFENVVGKSIGIIFTNSSITSSNVLDLDFEKKIGVSITVEQRF